MPTPRQLLEEELKQFLRLEAEASATLGYHDKRRAGLVASLQVQTAGKERTQAALLALDNS